jgi:SAM-dependent methyltransferase/biotin operon repressor
MAASKRARAKASANPTTLLNLVTGKWLSKAISVAAELGVADALADGTKPAAAIAQKIGGSEDGVYRLLRALEGAGLVIESRGRRFRLTPLGRLLRRSGPQAAGGFAEFMGHSSTWLPWGELGYSVRTGGPAFDHVFGMPVFQYFASNPEAATIFNSAMTSLSTWESGAVVAAYDFARIHTLVDVAGGHGLLISTVLKANKKVRGILFDLPHVLAGADTVLRSQGVASRCQTVGGDFFGTLPEGGDAYMMKHIVHDWDDERAVKILRNCRRAMRPGGRVLIIDVVIGSRNSGQYGKLLDLEMLVLTPHGRERTQAEFTELLKQAGLKIKRVVPTSGYLSILEAVAT